MFFPGKQDVKIGLLSNLDKADHELVTLVSYRIKTNGELSESFKRKRGVRQRDPLSPYLFLICAEGFTVLLKQAKVEGRIQGVSLPECSMCIPSAFLQMIH